MLHVQPKESTYTARDLSMLAMFALLSQQQGRRPAREAVSIHFVEQESALIVSDTEDAGDGE